MSDEKRPDSVGVLLSNSHAISKSPWLCLRASFPSCAWNPISTNLASFGSWPTSTEPDKWVAVFSDTAVKTKMRCCVHTWNYKDMMGTKVWQDLRRWNKTNATECQGFDSHPRQLLGELCCLFVVLYCLSSLLPAHCNLASNTVKVTEAPTQFCIVVYKDSLVKHHAQSRDVLIP